MTVSEPINIRDKDIVVWVFPYRMTQNRKISFKVKFYNSQTKYYQFIDINKILNINYLFMNESFLDVYNKSKDYLEILDIDDEISQKVKNELEIAFKELENKLSDEAKLFLECYE